jgi:hypothetical protein
MGILLAFMPFLAFALGDRLLGSTAGLIAGALTSAALLVRSGSGRGRSLKILEVGTLCLFFGLLLFAFVAKPAWSILHVRLCVDSGLLAIVLISIAVRRPFSIQYAREQVPTEYWTAPGFIHANYVITTVWAAAFLVMVIADLTMLYLRAVPLSVGIVATVIAVVLAATFTGWYPKRLAARR